MKSDGAMLYKRGKLGATLCTLGNKYICEGGIHDNKRAILWEEIETLFLDATKTSINFIPAGESITLQVVSTRGDKINLKQKALFRIGGKGKDNFLDVHQFIVSRIIDRQWKELINDIEEGKRVSFESFDITSTAIYRKKLFAGYDVIELYRIVGCDFDNGEFVIEFVDDKGHLKRKKSGYVREIPNIHLAQTFLSSIARHNVEAMNIPT